MLRSISKLVQLVSERRDEIAQFMGYGAVSAAALCVDVSVYWALISVARYAFVAAVGGYMCGVVLHYVLSSRVVFRSRFHSRGFVAEAPAVAKFFAAGASGLLVTVAVVGLLADVCGIHPIIAKLAAAGCSFVVVFMTLRLFVFNQRAHQSAPAIESDEPCLSPTMG